jgi:hypothetical protein
MKSGATISTRKDRQRFIKITPALKRADYDGIRSEE